MFCKAPFCLVLTRAPPVAVGTAGGAAHVSAHWPRFVPAFSLKKDCGSNKAAVDYFSESMWATDKITCMGKMPSPNWGGPLKVLGCGLGGVGFGGSPYRSWRFGEPLQSSSQLLTTLFGYSCQLLVVHSSTAFSTDIPLIQNASIRCHLIHLSSLWWTHNQRRGHRGMVAASCQAFPYNSAWDLLLRLTRPPSFMRAAFIY